VNRNSLKVLILVVCFTFSFSSLIVAQDKDKVRLQGVLVELDLKKRVMMVNETTFFCDGNTVFNDSKGVLIPVDKFKIKAWVYVEGEKDKGNKKVAKKVYLLPKYIEEKERYLYPFIQHQ
jgi:hypothetical protein